MVDNVNFVKSAPLRAFIGSFQHFADIYLGINKSVCISLGWGKGCIRFWGRLDQNSGLHGN